MGRRLLLALVGLAAGWLALELWFGFREPPPPAGADGRRSVFTPSRAQRAAWTKTLAELRRAPRPASFVANRFHPRYGWCNVPASRGVHQGIEVSFDEHGARGAPGTNRPPVPPDEGALRVACYGESFTFGTEVGDADTWPARLSAHADGALEVLNLGVGGWGTDQALLRFRDTRAELAPDVVLVGLLSENIGRNVNRLRNLYQPRTKALLVKPRFVLAEDGDALVLVPQPYATEVELFEAALDGSLGVDMAEHEFWARGTRSWSHVLDAVRSVRDVHNRAWWKLWWDPEGEPYRVTCALLEAFHDEALAGGARFGGVVIFPCKEDLDSRGRRLGILTADLEARGIPHLDLYPLCRARRARGERVYLEAHFTPETNDAVARAVWEWLRDELEL